MLFELIYDLLSLSRSISLQGAAICGFIYSLFSWGAAEVPLRQQKRNTNKSIHYLSVIRAKGVD